VILRDFEEESVPPDYFTPEHFKFGGGATETVLHPIVLVAMLIAIVLTLLLPRKYVMVPLLFVTILTPLGQVLLIGGLHVFVLRIMILTGWVRMIGTRILSQTGILGGGFNALDTAFLLWAVLRALAFVLLYLDPAAVVNQLGFLWDTLGGYFLLRFLIQDQDDIKRALKCFAVLVFVLAAGMVNEQLTGHNIFGALGGVRAISEIRDGRIRSQAVFQHALLAGAFGATLFSLFALLWKFGKAKFLSFVAMISSVVMVVTSATSTSIIAFGAGVVGFLFWPFRRQMRTVRWGAVIALLALQLVMKAPVWFAISHIDLTGGSSSYHRAELIDHFIGNFRGWWLVGTKSNATWGADMWDTCNQYVQEGEDGGLATFLSFLAMIIIAFRWIGVARKSVEGDRQKELYYWIVGATLFSHVIGFFGISYFDQSRMAWFALLAMISAATLGVRTPLATQSAPAFAPAPLRALGMERSSSRPAAPDARGLTQTRTKLMPR
jgi:hypothetical protein